MPEAAAGRLLLTIAGSTLPTAATLTGIIAGARTTTWTTAAAMNVDMTTAGMAMVMVNVGTAEIVSVVMGTAATMTAATMTVNGVTAIADITVETARATAVVTGMETAIVAETTEDTAMTGMGGVGMRTVDMKAADMRAGDMIAEVTPRVTGCALMHRGLHPLDEYAMHC